ncbi:MAG: serine hydroxymethyltransferase [Alphaproteobacteria bacterium]|nr:serine hydroxymethyltransferase [Alphaproteobacteria bacterium]
MTRSAPLSRTPKTDAGYFSAELRDVDPEVWQAIEDELGRQQDEIELIASENIVSRAVLQAQGSILTNKTVEGYAGRRYHGGASRVDRIETLAIERAKALFGCAFANVQPHSGSQANLAVFLALLNPGDGVLSMDLAAGGHLSHGAPVNLSGKWFRVASYGASAADARIDYAEVRARARAHAPRLIIAGGSSYPRVIDFARFRTIADEVGATLLVDMAHFAGLVAGGVYPSPLPHAHVVTTTTYKSLRGPRGGLILCNDPDIAKRINAAVFPGVQGTPLLHVVAGKAVCLGEALRPEFGPYAARVLANARALADTLVRRGYDVVTGGTDMPLLIVDLRRHGLTGQTASAALEAAGLTANKNMVPGDPEKPAVTSGLRLGASAGTTRGFGEAEFRTIGTLIAHVLDDLRQGPGVRPGPAEGVKSEVEALCRGFPVYRRAIG